jgi:hypothetical protein
MLMPTIEETQPPQKDPYEEFIETVLDRVEKTMKKELDTIKAEFLEKIRIAEEEKINDIYDECRMEFKKEIENKQIEIEQAYRIVNIQAALLSRILEENKDSVLRVLHTANLSEDELVLLSGNTRMRQERD